MLKKLFTFMILTGMTATMFGQNIPLAKPQAKIGMDLFDAIKARTSVSSFVKRDVPIADLSMILWAGNGLTRPDAVSGASRARTIPNPGEWGYVNIYAFTSNGMYRYDAADNLLKQLSNKDVRAQVISDYIESASLMLLFTYAVDFYAPLSLKSNPELVHEMAIETAGCAVENIALAAAAFNLGSLVTYNTNAIAAAVAAKLGDLDKPLFIMQLGYFQ